MAINQRAIGMPIKSARMYRASFLRRTGILWIESVISTDCRNDSRKSLNRYASICDSIARTASFTCAETRAQSGSLSGIALSGAMLGPFEMVGPFDWKRKRTGEANR